ncbi:MAG: CotH kinase family protein [Oscillospiraceae bacterium]
MSTHKNIDRICTIAVIISIVLSLLLMNGEVFGIIQTVSAMGYENRLFDTSKVHTIDIVMDDWDSFIDTAQSEEYSECAVIIDGEAYKNVGIRGKGNTSLSTVSSMNSERYSFKVEFDKYDKNKSYYGLDKLCLNNIIQDNTYMKDYLTYQMMNEFGVDTPLCSYVYITVNGEDWGLYLAVEGVEDAFLERNYGSDYGELYKPDSMSFGGGRGNGMDFKMEDFMNNSDSEESADTSDTRGRFPEQKDFNPSDMQGQMPEDFDFSAIEDGEFPMPEMNGGGMPGGSMGSSDVKLQYIDDDADSYSNIFDNAKTDITDSDKKRLISSLKNLSENADIESVVNVEEVIRYFVVHNFVCNGDSYTGSMIHNYYLYEEDGQLSMIPWDYNLAFGTFQSDDATGQVNSPIDTPVSGDMSDRPMISWIFENEEYTEMYHQYFYELLSSVDIDKIIDEVTVLISPYVEKDPTKFCTYEEFEIGVSTIRSFCELRSESIQGQLDGTIPSTTDGQSADSSSLIDASSVSLSDMGTMNMGGMNKGGFGGRSNQNMPQKNENEVQQTNIMQTANITPVADGGNMPKGDMKPPEDFNGEIPDFENMDIPTDENGNPAIPNQFGENEKTTSVNKSGANADNNDNAAQNKFGQNGKMPDFSNMQLPQDSGNTENNAVSYVLLGISVLLLGGGLLFAFKFKR